MQQVLAVARARPGKGVGQPGIIGDQPAQQRATLGEPACLTGIFIGQAGHGLDESSQRCDVGHGGALHGRAA